MLLFLFLISIFFIGLADAMQYTYKEITTTHGTLAIKKFYTEQTATKTPLVIIHGGPGLSHQYLLDLKALAVLQPIIFYDQIGCGASKLAPNTEAPYNLDYYLDELSLIANEMHLEKMSLLGHSWGGAIAAQYTLQNPTRVDRLILASPLLSTQRWIEDSKVLLSKLPDQTQRIIEKFEVAENFASQEYQNACKEYYDKHLCRLKILPEPLLASLQEINSTIYNTMWGPSEFTATGTLKTFDCSTQLHQLTLPVLVTCGRFDEARPETMREFAQKMQQAELYVFEHSAHCAHLEEPDLYLKIVSDFLSKDHKH